MDILVRSWQDLGTILAKILSKSCHGIHFAMVRFYQDRHVSKKNLKKKPKMARKILLRSPRWQEKFATNCLISRKEAASEKLQIKSY